MIIYIYINGFKKGVFRTGDDRVGVLPEESANFVHAHRSCLVRRVGCGLQGEGRVVQLRPAGIDLKDCVFEARLHRSCKVVALFLSAFPMFVPSLSW
eukprot:COSAG06_NODE_7560_length_2459_cov_2.031780_1_plen_97_part_00